jgi:hypothetical protein
MAKRTRKPRTKKADRTEWDVAAAEREFARNKARIDACATYRARQSTGWRLGGSPSTAGEIKR